MTIEIYAGGMIHGGWKEARITRGANRAAGDFSCTASNRWPGQDVPPTLRIGDACAVTIDGEQVISGYIDIVETSIDPDKHVVRFAGRSKTGQLCDCSPPPGDWNNVPIEEIAAQVAKPFGVNVRMAAGPVPPLPSAHVHPGETAFNFLHRLALRRGLLLSDNANGDLVFTRAGANRAEAGLQLRADGRESNVLQGSASFNLWQRFSDYTVLGQSVGTDHRFGEQAAGVSATVADRNVRLHRPLTIMAEGNVMPQDAKIRAQWERAQRAGASFSASYVVQGWRQRPGGPLWAPNLLVKVADDALKVYGDYLIAEVQYRVGAGGTTTTLRIVPPEAMEPQPGGMPDAAGDGAGYWPALEDAAGA